MNAAAFNANPGAYSLPGNTSLGQSGSLTGQSYIPVPRVLALIDARGNASTSTALLNTYDANNPRSAFTADGTTVYASGQGIKGDVTGGVFLSNIGVLNNAPTPITGLDTSNGTAAQDTRAISIVNNTLYVSVDTKAGSGSNRDYLGTLGTRGTLPASTVGGPVMLTGFGSSTGKVAIAGNGNGLNEGQQINLSPENFFFASASVLYVTDSGSPKNNSATSSLGNGGLQKWINSAADGSGTWTLAYTVGSGLHLVANTASTGTSGLYGLAATVKNGNALLYATTYSLADVGRTYLCGVADPLNATSPAMAAKETFSLLATAPIGSNFKGVSFAPTVAPETTLQASGTWVNRGGNGYGLRITVRNTGSVTAQDVTLTGVKIGATSALTSPLDLGPLAPGTSQTTTLVIPTLTGTPNTPVTERITGTSSAGTFAANLRTAIPSVF